MKKFIILRQTSVNNFHLFIENEDIFWHKKENYLPGVIIAWDNYNKKNKKIFSDLLKKYRDNALAPQFSDFWNNINESDKQKTINSINNDLSLI